MARSSVWESNGSDSYDIFGWYPTFSGLAGIESQLISLFSLQEVVPKRVGSALLPSRLRKQPALWFLGWAGERHRRVLPPSGPVPA